MKIVILAFAKISPLLKFSAILITSAVKYLPYNVHCNALLSSCSSSVNLL
jgi:hypothetical protein